MDKPLIQEILASALVDWIEYARHSGRSLPQSDQDWDEWADEVGWQVSDWLDCDEAREAMKDDDDDSE